MKEYDPVVPLKGSPTLIFGPGHTAVGETTVTSNNMNGILSQVSVDNLEDAVQCARAMPRCWRA